MNSNQKCHYLLAYPLIGVTWLVQFMAPAYADEGWQERVNFTAQLEALIAVSTKSGEVQLSEIIVTPEITVELPGDWRLTTIGRFRADASDRLEPGEPSEANRDPLSRRAFIGDKFDIELREFYVDGDIGDVFVRLGKQQVVWGEADGLKVLDVINPQSFREFILADFDFSRIPLWMAKAQIPIGDATLELVWVPDQTYHDIPDTNAEFAITAPSLVPQPSGLPVTILSTDRPNEFFADSDIGARVTTFAGGWEFSLNYFYHYTDAPVLRRNIEPGSVSLSTGYERTHLIGGSFNTAVGDFVLRGEVGYSTDKFFLVDDLTDADGVAKSAELSYVVGVDWTGLTDTFISGQFFQTILIDNTPGIIRDKVENRATIFARRTFMNERVTASALVVQSLNDGDGVIEAEVTFDLADNVELFAGADFFYGKSTGVFGQFNDSDRVLIGVRFGFLD